MWPRRALIAVVLIAGCRRHSVVNPPLAAGVPRISRAFVFEAQPAKLAPGEQAVLRWNVPGAGQVLIEESSQLGEMREIGWFAEKGSVTVRPLGDTMYVISCRAARLYARPPRSACGDQLDLAAA